MVRNYWSGRSGFFGRADAEHDALQVGWLEKLLVTTHPVESAIRGDALLVIGRKGSGKSAIRIAAQQRRAQTGILSVSADETVALHADKLRDPQIPPIANWLRMYAFLISRAVAERALKERGRSLTQLQEQSLLTWAKDTQFTENQIRRQITEGLAAAGFQPEQSRALHLYIDDFDNLYKAGTRTYTVDQIRSAIEAADRLTVVANSVRITLCLREDLWLLCRPGWHYLDKLTNVIDLRWTDDELKEWARRRLIRAVVEGGNIAEEELLGLSFERLWGIFFPPVIELEDGKTSASFGYILRRTLYTPRDVHKFVTRIAEKTKRWPATQDEVTEAERLYSLDRLEYLVNEFGSLCDGLSTCLHSFTAKPMEWVAQALYKHLNALIQSGDVRLVDAMGDKRSAFELARFLFRIGFLEVRYQQDDRFEVRDALRYPDHWQGLRRDDSLKWAVRSAFYRALESRRLKNTDPFGSNPERAK